MEVAGLVVVEVKTDLRPLEQGLSEARQKAQQLDKELSGAFKGPTEAAKQFGNEVAGSFSKFTNRSAWGNFDAQANAVRMGLRSTTQAANDTGVALTTVGAAAASAGSDIGRVEGATRAATTGTAALVTGLSALRLVLIGITAAAAALGITLTSIFTANKFLTESVNAEREQQKLASALQATGNAAQQSMESLNAHADALKRTTEFAGGAINTAQATLLTFDRISGATFERATEAALDMAAAMNTDVNSAALRIGRALQDPVQAMSQLSRAGIRFSEGQRRLIRDLVETGDVATAQGIILQELEGRYEGAARAARDTLGGALRSLGNAINDAFTLSPEATRPLRDAVESLITAIQDPAFTNFVQTIGSAFVQAMAAAVGAIELLVDTVGAASAGLVALGESLGGWGSVVDTLTTSLGILIGYKIAGWALAAAEALLALRGAFTLAAAGTVALRTATIALSGTYSLLAGAIAAINWPAAALTAAAFGAYKLGEAYLAAKESSAQLAAAQDLVNEAMGRSMVGDVTQATYERAKAELAAANAVLFSAEANLTLLQSRRQLSAFEAPLGFEAPALDPAIEAVTARVAKARQDADNLGMTLQGVARDVVKDVSNDTEVFKQSVNDTAKVFDIAGEKVGNFNTAVGATATSMNAVSTAASGFNQLGASVQSVVQPHRDALASIVSVNDELDKAEIQLRKYYFAVEEAQTLSWFDVMGRAEDINAANAALESGTNTIIKMFAEFNRGAMDANAFWNEVDKVRNSMHAVAGEGNSVDPFIDGLVKALLQAANLEDRVISLSNSISNIPSKTVDITIRQHTVMTSSGGPGQVTVHSYNPPGSAVQRTDGSTPQGGSGSIGLYPGGSPMDPFQSGIDVYRNTAGVNTNLANTLPGFTVTPRTVSAPPSMLTSGFSSGGFTGHAPTDQVAGFVHGQEYVFDAQSTARIGVANLDAIRSGVQGFQGGGFVTVSGGAPGMIRAASEAIRKLTSGDTSLSSPDDYLMEEATAMAVDHAKTVREENAKYGWFDIPQAPSSSGSGNQFGGAGRISSGFGTMFSQYGTGTTYDYHDPKAPYHFRPSPMSGAVYDPLADFMFNGNWGALSVIASAPTNIMYEAPKWLSGNPANYMTNYELAEQLARQGPTIGTYGGQLTFSAGSSSDFLGGTGFFGEGSRMAAGGMGSLPTGQVRALDTQMIEDRATAMSLKISDADDRIAIFGYDPFQGPPAFSTGGMIHPGDNQQVEFFKRPDETVIIVRPEQLRDLRGTATPSLAPTLDDLLPGLAAASAAPLGSAPTQTPAMASAASSPAIPAVPPSISMSEIERGAIPAIPAIPPSHQASEMDRGATPAIRAVPAEPSTVGAAIPAVPAVPASPASAPPSPAPVGGVGVSVSGGQAAKAEVVQKHVHLNIPAVTIISPEPVSRESAAEFNDRLRTLLMEYEEAN